MFAVANGNEARGWAGASTVESWPRTKDRKMGYSMVDVNDIQRLMNVDDGSEELVMIEWLMVEHWLNNGIVSIYNSYSKHLFDNWG